MLLTCLYIILKGKREIFYEILKHKGKFFKTIMYLEVKHWRCKVETTFGYSANKMRPHTLCQIISMQVVYRSLFAKHLWSIVQFFISLK